MDLNKTIPLMIIEHFVYCYIDSTLLLYCTRKKKKPPHYQLPSGHVDAAEFKQVSHNASRFVTQEQLYPSTRLGCIREVYKETGIDLRKELGRLRPMILFDKSERG